MMSSTAEWHLRRNHDAREAFVSLYPCLTGKEVGERGQRWEEEGRAFSIERRGDRLYPAFQFGPDGRPLPIVAQVLAHFPPSASAWERASWWVGGSGWLGGLRPIDLLASQPAKVLAAARSHFSSAEGF